MTSLLHFPRRGRLLEPESAIVIQQTQSGVWIILVFNVLFAAHDLWVMASPLRLLMQLSGAQIAMAAVGLIALRNRTFHASAGMIGGTVFASATLITSLAGIVAGDGTTTPLQCIALTLAASAVMPWGARGQLAAAGVATAAILINGYYLEQLGYPTVAALAAVGTSVFISQQLESQRDAEHRAVGALRDREQFLRLIANGLPALIAYIDSDGRCRFANRAFEDWFGLARTVMNGQSLVDFLAPEAMEQLRPHVVAALSGREVSFEALFTDRYGHSRTFQLTYVPDTNADGTVRGFFSLASDATERKQAEESIRQHQAQLAHALRLRTMGEMASALAHELNQPLAAIAAYATSSSMLVPDEPGTAELRRQVLQISQEAHRAGEVIKRVQGFCRREAPRWEPVQVNHVVEESVRLVEMEAHQIGIAVRLDLAPILPMVEADSIQLEQVVINLLLNAFQAVDASRNPVRCVDVTTSQHRGGDVEVAIRDSGVGLSAGIAKKIFEPYFTTRNDGLGMGLTISRSIIEAHGGRLWATANPPPERAGATFRFRLPGGRPVDGASPEA